MRPEDDAGLGGPELLFFHRWPLAIIELRPDVGSDSIGVSNLIWAVPVHQHRVAKSLVVKPGSVLSCVFEPDELLRVRVAIHIRDRPPQAYVNLSDRWI